MALMIRNGALSTNRVYKIDVESRNRSDKMIKLNIQNQDKCERKKKLIYT